jgi:hypothetical protein
MHALTNLGTTPARMAALALLVALAATLACAPGGCHRGGGHRAVACRAALARKTLTFGLSREAALDAIGRSEAVPPWKNARGLGPALISNPFDSQTYTSELGEEYEVVRFFVGASGNRKCPFVQGSLRLEPLIFVDDELVGWKWSYLADVLDRRLTKKETSWNFGAFCDGKRIDSPDAGPPEPTAPDPDPPPAADQ